MVTKIPRFTFEKFPAANDRLTTQMKSVGEVMAIGRTFQESLQKALRGLETGLDGLGEQLTLPLNEESASKLEYELRVPGANRLLFTADAFRAGWSFEKIQKLTHIDPRFLAQLEDLVLEEQQVAERGMSGLNAERLRELKRKGVLGRAPRTAGRSGGKGRAPAPPRAGNPSGLQGGWTPAPRNLRPRPPTCIPPTRRSARRRPMIGARS